MSDARRPDVDLADGPTTTSDASDQGERREPRGSELDVAPTGMPSAARRRRFDRGLLGASVLIAGGLVLIVWGFLGAVTGDEGIDRPDAIENLTPVENAVQVLQQEPVIVDLEFGFEGELTIDGIELPTTRIGEIVVEPGEQIEFPPTAIFDPGNAIISFQPVDDAPIERFSAGIHRVELIYWPIDEGRDAARTYTWTFNAV